MFIEGKNSINIQMIYQGKAGAVCITQPFIINLSENSLCIFFNVFSNAKDSNIAFIHLIHEPDCCGMAASHLEKCISFIQDIIRSADNSFVFMNLFVNRFCFVVMLVFWNSEGAESACINKNLQFADSPYRYLS